MIIQRHNAVDVVISTTKDSGSARSTDTVGHITVIKQHTLLSKTVDVWRIVDSSTIAADGLGRMVISHDEDDVWTAIAAAAC